MDLSYWVSRGINGRYQARHSILSLRQSKNFLPPGSELQNLKVTTRTSQTSRKFAKRAQKMIFLKFYCYFRKIRAFKYRSLLSYCIE